MTVERLARPIRAWVEGDASKAPGLARQPVPSDRPWPPTAGPPGSGGARRSERGSWPAGGWRQQPSAQTVCVIGRTSSVAVSNAPRIASQRADRSAGGRARTTRPPAAEVDRGRLWRRVDGGHGSRLAVAAQPAMRPATTTIAGEAGGDARTVPPDGLRWHDEAVSRPRPCDQVGRGPAVDRHDGEQEPQGDEGDAELGHLRLRDQVRQRQTPR
jgi:hypothetical protein